MKWISRRTIPPATALLVFLGSIQTLWTGWPSENVAIRWTLLLVVLAATAKALLSSWMWRRMHR